MNRKDIVYYIINNDLEEDRIDYMRPFANREDAEAAAIEENIENYDILEFDVH